MYIYIHIIHNILYVYIYIIVWWLSHPSENYKFVSWDPRRLADIFPQPGHDAAEQIDARSHDLNDVWRYNGHHGERGFFYEKMRWRCHENQQKRRENDIEDDMKMTAKHVNMIEYEYLRLYLPIVDVKWCKYAGHPTNALILKHQNYVGASSPAWRSGDWPSMIRWSNRNSLRLLT